MDEEQAVSEQLTFSEFKKWSSTALKTFNNSTIIIPPCSGEFRVVFKHFQNLENLILNILKEKLYISCLVGSFFLKIA